MPGKLTIEPTKLEFGYFYNLWNDVILAADDPELGWGEETSIFSTDPRQDKMFWCEVVGYEEKKVQRFKCDVNLRHGMMDEVFRCQLDIHRGPTAGAFVPSGGGYVIISDWLAERLKASSLTGWRALPCRIPDYTRNFDGPKRPPKLFQLAFDGIAPWMRPHIEPASDAKCPFCGKGPLVCPGCGEWRNPCEQCGKEWCVELKNHGGPTDRRIVIDPEWPDVFDIRHWDGTDFMGASHGGRITRRALDWLLSIHAAPFRAEPIAVNVAGLSKAELDRLEEVRKPLPNVTPPPLEKFTKKPKK